MNNFHEDYPRLHYFTFFFPYFSNNVFDILTSDIDLCFIVEQCDSLGLKQRRRFNNEPSQS